MQECYAIMALENYTTNRIARHSFVDLFGFISSVRCYLSGREKECASYLQTQFVIAM